MPNNLEFTQAATLLNDIQEQVTGVKSIAPADTSEFVSVAETLLKTGYESVYKGISQVLSRTIFSIRPYNRKFVLAEISAAAYGNHVRKISIADTPVEDDDRFKWPVKHDENENPPSGDGKSVDMQTIKKNQVLQTNFYGANVFQDHYTLFDTQLDVAFSSPEELARFIASITMNMSNKLEQYAEDTGRAVVLNSILSTLDIGAGSAPTAFSYNTRVIPLLTLYNVTTGGNYTITSILQPDNFVAFVRWAYSVMETVSDMMTERSVLYQTTINNKYIPRHTPKDKQKLFLSAQFAAMVKTMVQTVNFNDGYMQLPNGVRAESVGYWQAINSPLSVAGTASYTGTDGTITKKTFPASGEGAAPLILGFLFDEEALGWATVRDRMYPAPYNARGEYQNFWIHKTIKAFNDVTEKSVVFTLA